jgi:hypothetical protein
MPPRKIVEYLQGDEGVNVDENELLQRIGAIKKRLSRQDWNEAEVGALSLALVKLGVFLDPGTLDEQLKELRQALPNRPKKQIYAHAKELLADAERKWAAQPAATE